ncbi:cytochrome P450 [Paractinoplanes hotanensis]|uniref:Cytochrome P450 n=1 Tax=Paractinoplanes hotanensis TaxID=2906497 RepID=A0ABT0Y4T5_9ACTN|nr:cytochrome P450 [Actinoplanes hotanensis]MCM4081059.1 cytochrome P450 [Actinoplanes hotanensis]
MKATTRISAARAFGQFRRDPLALFAQIADQPDGVALSSVAGRRLLFITHPDHVARVLRDNHRQYSKDAPVYRAARPFLGDGLTVAAGGEDWMRRRRLVQPAFHRDTLGAAAAIAVDCVGDLVTAWSEPARRNEVVDVAPAMTDLTMRISCRHLFGMDLTSGASEVAADLRMVCDFVVGFLARPFPPPGVPTRRNREFRAAMGRIRAFIGELVAHPATDLVAALDAEARSGGSTPEQVGDELLGLFFAGHETLAHTLTWCWSLLVTHPEVAERLHGEVTRVLSGRPASADDLPELSWTRAVVDEAMRLYPVVWIMMRRALGRDEIDGHEVRAGDLIAWSPYVGNRHPQVWRRPSEFLPERWHSAGDRGPDWARHSVAPFGLGPRACLGSGAAVMQACLILATLVQAYHLEPVGDGPPRPNPSLTLHAAGGFPARLRRR